MGVDTELDALKLVLKKTFDNIKTDISVSSKEIERLHEYNRKLEMQFLQLQQELKTFKDSQTAPMGVEPALAQKLAEIEKKLDMQLQQQMQQAQQTPQKMPEKGLTAQIMRTVDRNRKSLIKKKILSVIATQELTLPELKDILVDEQNLCSKATFYRYFEELKRRGQLDLAEVDEIKLIVPTKKAETALR